MDLSKLKYFSLDVFYDKLVSIVQTTQKTLSLGERQQPIPVSVENPISELPTYVPPVIGFSVNFANSMILSSIIENLTENKAIVHDYLLKKVPCVSCKEIVSYYDRIQRGQWYKCDNFSINMRGLLHRVLRDAIPNLTVLWEQHLVSTMVGNLTDLEVDRLAKLLCIESTISCSIQKLHFACQQYFSRPEVHSKVLDRVAFRLSYGNEFIRDAIDSVYDKPVSSTKTLHAIQDEFRELFSTSVFAYCE